MSQFFDIYLPLEVRGATLLGYGWVFPVGENVANIGVGCMRWKDSCRLPPLNRILSDFIQDLCRREKRRFGDIESLGHPVGSPLGTSCDDKRNSDRNLTFVGDAAGTTDPLTGEGIAPAVESGILAATHIHESLTRGTSTVQYERDLKFKMPRIGQDFSCIARSMWQLSRSEHALLSRTQLPSLARAVQFMVTDPDPRPDPHGTPISALLCRMSSRTAAQMVRVDETLLEEAATHFPLAAPMIDREIRSHGGPVYAASLICAAYAWGEPNGHEITLGAQAAEYLAPFPLLLRKLSDRNNGAADKLNNALTMLTADFAISRAMIAMSKVSPKVAVDLALAARQVCEAGMMDVTDRYDLGRSLERYLESIERRCGSIFAFSVGLGAELGGASTAAVEHARQYGRDVGVAYGITEDLVELASAAENGSDFASSLRRGIYSLPVLTASQHSPRVRKRLLSGVRDDPVAEMVMEIYDTGAADDALRLVMQRLGDAEASLTESIPATSDLSRLSAWVGERAAASLDAVREISTTCP